MKNSSSSSSASVVLALLLLVLASSPSANEAFSSSLSSYSSHYSCNASSSRRRRRPIRRPHDGGGFASLSSPPPVHRRPRLHLASSLVEPPSPLRRAGGGESSSSSSACVVDDDDDDDDDGAAVRLLPSTATTTPPGQQRKSRQQHRRRLSADYVINTSILLSVIFVVLEQVLSIDVGITRGWSAIEMVDRVPLDNWRAYSHVLHSSPIATKAITSGAVYAIGDVLSQRSTGSDMGDLDRGRVLRSLVAGFVGHGPMSHVWYHASEAFFDDVVRMPHAWYDFVPKVMLDQAIFGPIWNNSYILLLGVMQLHRPGRIWDDMKRTTLPLLLKGLKLWPFVHVITYGLIPVENRLLWVDAVEIVWVTILASTASSSPPPPGGEEEKEKEEETEDKI